MARVSKHSHLAPTQPPQSISAIDGLSSIGRTQDGLERDQLRQPDALHVEQRVTPLRLVALPRSGGFIQISFPLTRRSHSQTETETETRLC
jgi:hypothetical protein